MTTPFSIQVPIYTCSQECVGRGEGRSLGGGLEVYSLFRQTFCEAYFPFTSSVLLQKGIYHLKIKHSKTKSVFDIENLNAIKVLQCLSFPKASTWEFLLKCHP